MTLAAEIREMDRRSIEDLKIPGRLLMELAGAGSARVIGERVSRAQGRAVILCGPGGNGGDGYVVARHLQDQGWTVRCISIVPPEALQGETRDNHALWARLASCSAVARLSFRLGLRFSAGLALCARLPLCAGLVASRNCLLQLLCQQLLFLS